MGRVTLEILIPWSTTAHKARLGDMLVIIALERRNQKDLKFKLIPKYIASSTPAWAM